MRTFFGSHGEPIIVNGSVDTSPTDGDVLADSGVVPYAGVYWFLVHLSWNGGSTAMEFDVQRRNAANDGNVEVVPVNMPAEGSAQFDMVFNLVAGERVRVTCGETVAGVAQSSLYGSRIA